MIIEDEVKLLDSLRRGLSQEFYDVSTATTGEGGFYLATTETFDAILLDLMLPGRDGMQILSELRAKGVAVPVLILTARDAVEDRCWRKRLMECSNAWNNRIVAAHDGTIRLESTLGRGTSVIVLLPSQGDN